MAIDRIILFDMVIKLLHKKNSFDELTEFLLEKVIFNDTMKNVRFRSPPEAWEDLPKDKSLFGSKPGCGLPIGNLTSQLFANVYLNPLDQYIKRELKIQYYGRYVDDMVLVHDDKEALLNAISDIKRFLLDNLGLVLHPKKIKLQEASKGFEFLGAFIHPYSIVPGKRIIRNFRNAVFNEDKHVVQSYVGLVGWFIHILKPSGLPQGLLSVVKLDIMII